MKEIQLTQDKVALVDDIDYEYLSQWKWCASWDGKHWRPVRGVWIDGKSKIFRMYILIAERMEIDANYIDHKDRNPLNNQRLNLRGATGSQNGQNRGINSNNTTGVKGVSFHTSRGRYRARIRVEGIQYFLGYFDTVAEAEKVVVAKREELVGEFACH